MTNLSKGLLQHGRSSDLSQVEAMKDKHADGWAHRRTDTIPRWAFLWICTEFDNLKLYQENGRYTGAFATT